MKEKRIWYSLAKVESTKYISSSLKINGIRSIPTCLRISGEIISEHPAHPFRMLTALIWRRTWILSWVSAVRVRGRKLSCPFKDISRVLRVWCAFTFIVETDGHQIYEQIQVLKCYWGQIFEGIAPKVEVWPSWTSARRESSYQKRPIHKFYMPKLTRVRTSVPYLVFNEMGSVRVCDEMDEYNASATTLDGYGLRVLRVLRNKNIISNSAKSTSTFSNTSG